MKIGIEGPKTLKMNMIIDLWNYYCYGEACPLSSLPLDETLTFNGVAREYVLF